MKSAPKQIPELSEKDKARFFKYVDKRPDGIWNWVGTKKETHYGRFLIKGGMYRVHRISWALRERELGRTGIIPDDLQVLHRIEVTKDICDVNPDNLWLGTPADNARDRTAKGRTTMVAAQMALKKNPELWARGTKQWLSKLTESDVLSIRREHATGKQCPEIAAAFGVNASTILCIVKRQTWKHVA